MVLKLSQEDLIIGDIKWIRIFSAFIRYWWKKRLLKKEND